MPAAPFLALITPIGDSGGPRPPTGPVDPGYSPPWAQLPPGVPGPGGPVDPGYSPPWAQVPPGTGPGGPVDPGYSPPWARPPLGFWGGGNVPFPTPPIYIPVVPPPTDPNAPHPEHPIYIPVSPDLTPEQIEVVKQKLIEKWTGNLPTNPNPVPTPV